MFKSGFITMIGKYNVGKSTLLNTLLEEKISIISDKPNTTKQKIIGICNAVNYQLIFVDNPGIIYRNRSSLISGFNSVVFKNIHEIDVILFLVEHECRDEDKNFLTFLKKYKKKIILVISKIDLLKKKILIDRIILSYLEYFDFDAVIPISSFKKQNLEILKENILFLLKKNKPYFPKYIKSDISKEKLISELLREKLFFYLDKELPHVCKIFLEKVKFNEDNSSILIDISILVSKISQKKILIGHNGDKLKKIRISAQKEINKVFKAKSHLKLWVKVD